ncbi:MAG: hypothetical protein IKU43_07945 [Clostridia bacterium]|nr:hypothetical protein [Clostridia bacterium]
MKNSLITFSAVVGKPTKKECFEFLKSQKDNGISSAMIYPRSGCEIEYLSEEWFDTVGYFVEAAEVLDITLWLYDDFNWPSGDACGKVTEIERYRSKSIFTEGEHIGEISSRSKHNTSVFSEKFFPDLLSEEAVDYFIEVTHEEYYKRFGQYFGSIIKGIFTDEPSFAYTCEGTRCPWYDGIEADYNDTFGRDYKDDLYNNKETFKINSYKLASIKFNECFIKKISDWCKNHGILMTGHLMSDSDPYSAVKYNGDFLKNLSGIDLPGIDFIETNFKSDTLINLLASAEYSSNSNGAVAELFALGPADMTYAKKRCMIYLCAAFKISHYFITIAHMDFRGNRLIKDYFTLCTADQPDFKGMKQLSAEADFASDLAKKDYTPDVYVLYPTEIGIENIGIKLNHSVYFKLLNKLSQYQIQWKYVNSKDECKDKPLIEYGREYQYFLDGKLYSDADELCKALNVTKCVTDCDGNIPDGLYVRRYDDGEILVVNMYAPGGVYSVCGRKYAIDEFGVIYTGTTPEYSEYDVVSKLECNFEVKYRTDNMVRAMFVNSQKDAEIICDSDMKVRFAVRDDAFLRLDGVEVQCTGFNSELLTTGLRKLYAVSDEIYLSKGKHILTSDNDLKYLPSVFIIGDFAQESLGGEICKTELSARKKAYIPGEHFQSYGRVEFIGEITVPDECSALLLDGTELLTEVYINGRLIDSKCFKPFIYSLCDEFRGTKVTLRIVQYSSIGPIFGDDEYYGKNSEAILWKNAPCITKTEFGFDSIEFIK